MKKALLFALVMILAASFMFSGCSSTQDKEGKTLIFVWYPNESGEDLKSVRDEIGKVIETATGKKVEHKLTTDYAIAIEAIATGNAHLAFPGPQGYVEAHTKNSKVVPLVVSSGASGTLKDAVYYSWIAVKKGNEDQYKSGNGFSLDNIAGKKFSFVSTSSTSGFKVPTAGIVSYFSKKDQWKGLKAENLQEGGNGKFFSQVFYGASHQGSAVNLLTDKVDVAAFCDETMDNYTDVVSGERNKPGSVYQIRQNAGEPFTKLAGAQYVIIASTPVLNTPIVANTEILSDKNREAILKALTSDETTHNPAIFLPKDSKAKGLFKVPAKFLQVDDAWFNPIRELSK